MSSNWTSSFDNSRRHRANVNHIWNVDFSPTSLDEIAVHKTKIKSLEDTLEQKLKHLSNPFLVLIGPPGCGKTASLHLVAKKLRILIHEWINPIQVDLTDFGDEDRQRFTYESQSHLFSEFLFKSNRYKGLKFADAMDCGRKVLLVKDIPNVFLREPSRFLDIVEKYSNLPQATPCVFIISDDEGTKLKRFLFPEYLIANAKIDVLKFNSIASTAMLKALQNVVCKVSKCILPNFRPPTKEDLENIVKSNNGDIRSAVNSLQFCCFKISQHLNSCGIKPSKSGKLERNIKRRSFIIGSKDENLSLFRVLGKILHSKRLQQIDSSELTLQDHLQHNKRSTLSFDPDEMLEKTCLNSDAYLASLHHNYINFSKNIEQLSQACDYISEADIMTQDWRGRSALKNCQASLVTRGVVFSLNHSDAVGWKPLYKPSTFDLNSKTLNLKEKLLQHFYLTCNNTSKLAMEILPFYINISYVNLNTEQFNVAFKIGNFEDNIKAPHEKLEDYNIDFTTEKHNEDFHFHSSDVSDKVYLGDHTVDNEKEDFLIEDSDN